MRVLRNRSAGCGFLVVVLAGLAWAAPAAADEPSKLPETPKLAEAIRRGWLRAGIVSGRLTFTATRLGSMNDAAKTGGREERVSIRIAGREISATYELSTSDERLLVEISGRDQLHLRYAPKGDSSRVPVDFRQSADEPLRLAVGREEQQHVCRAASLWHLFITQPDLCRQHLAPLLEVLGQQWDLGRMAEAVEAALVRGAAEGDLPDPRRWAHLVEQLGDERFSRRQAADRELRALGRAVYTYLHELETSQLDAEQHYRVRRILMTLEGSMQNDTPPEIAKWLAGDPAVWLALLSRQDESARRLAAGQLEALLGEPVRFEPAADPQVRADQIEQLRLRILNRR